MLYWAHPDDSEVTTKLRSLGTACIVEAEVPVEEIKCYSPVGERIVRWYLHRRRVRTEHDDDWEGHTTVSIPGAHVRRVVQRADAAFLALTGCNAWSVRIT